MRQLLIAVGAAFALSAGQTTGSIDTSLPKTCALIETAHAAFVAASAAGNIKASIIRREKAAYDGVQVICADPNNVTAASALVLTATAYATVSLAMREAKAAE